MTMHLTWMLLQIAIAIAMTACGGANEDHYNDRKVYVRTKSPSGGTADATVQPNSAKNNPGQTQSGSSGQGTEPAAPIQAGEVVASGNLVGALDAVSMSGRVAGWAAWDGDSSVIVTVNIAVDGVEVAKEVASDLDGFDADTAGKHAFQFTLPDSYKDGFEHELLVVAKHNAETLEFNKQTFKMDAPSQAGKEFFAASVESQLRARCAGCHPVNYQQQYASLSTPDSTQGGSAINNELINMASGRNGNVNHPGGNICGNKNSGVCAQIQQWWTAEFVKK